ncbi:hypothetical protein C8F04DRAFT_1274615 [Mycena alexandri]|uniref:Uncharacterized protein n=1 Tax=Mycena alexandri TaxID=1745969 RepID=A0AAD6S4J1_9AGAR|nr:hypothetical protein C8F04DRAFT_1274615 [Mycena alexandri]
MGDRKAKYFTGEDFFKLSLEDEREKREEAAEKEARQERREAHTAELVEWKKENDGIRARNEAKKLEFAADTTAWEMERDEAKAEKRRAGWPKPKWKDYKPEKQLPRPRKPRNDDPEEEDRDEGSENGSIIGDD